MKRQMIRLALALVLVVLTAVAAVLFSADYSKESDPEARFDLVAANLKKDESFYWLDLHLRRNGSANHDMRKPVRLVTGDGLEHIPADTVFAGNPEDGFTEIWLKFWVEKKDLEDRVVLKINDGVLSVKTNAGVPDLKEGSEGTFKSEDWSKSWLGF